MHKCKLCHASSCGETSSLFSVPCFYCNTTAESTIGCAPEPRDANTSTRALSRHSRVCSHVSGTQTIDGPRWFLSGYTSSIIFLSRIEVTWQHVNIFIFKFSSLILILIKNYFSFLKCFQKIYIGSTYIFKGSWRINMSNVHFFQLYDL